MKTRHFAVLLSVLAFATALTACKGGGGGGTALPFASGLRVKVVSYDGLSSQLQVVPGATVVLGDSTGAMIASAQTDANGVVTFWSPPQNATVTSAVTGTGFYSLHTFYDVNVPAVTISLYKSSTPAKLGTVNFTVTCNGASSVLMLGSTPSWSWKLCSGGTATASVGVYPYDQQVDGKFSFLALGNDISGNPISFGSLLDQPFIDGMPVNITLATQVSSPFQEQVTYANIPVNNGGYAWASMNMRRTGGQSIYYGTSSAGFPSLMPLSSSLTLTFNVPVPTGFATSYGVGGFLYLDTNNTGTVDRYFRFWQQMAVPTVLNFDLNAFPQAPSGVSVTNATTDRPAISFNIATMPLITMSPVVSGPSTTLYSYKIEMPNTRTSVVFPELPASLAAFRPGAWAGQFNLNIENDQRDYCSSYSDCLTKNDTWGGTVGVSAFLSKSVGDNYAVNGASMTLAKPGPASAPTPPL